MQRVILGFVLVCGFLQGCERRTEIVDAQSSSHQTTITNAAQIESAGPISRKLIGEIGGELASSDGRIRLIVPPKALKAPVEISIEPLSGTLPGGVNTAYRFMPDGLKFETPIQVAVALDSTTGEVGAPLLGTLTSDGKWIGGGKRKNVATDGKTAFYEIAHFSDWAVFTRWSISPSEATVKIGESIDDLDVYFFEDCSDAETADCLLTPFSGNAKVKKWLVNGIEGGNKAVGTVSGGGRGRYVAPQTVPKVNPVAVTAVIDAGKSKEVQVVANITVIPAGWSGQVNVKFTSTSDSSNQAINEHAAERALSKGHITESQRLSMLEGERESAQFQASYAIDAAMSEAASDDGTVLAVLQLKRPKVYFEYFYSQTQECYGGYTMKVRSGREDAKSYQSIKPGPITFQTYADRSSSILMSVGSALVNISGSDERVDCDGKGEKTDVDPFMDSMGDVGNLQGGVSITGNPSASELAALTAGQSTSNGVESRAFAIPGVFKGPKGDGARFKGKVAVAGELTIEGRRIPGTYTISWDIRTGK